MTFTNHVRETKAKIAVEAFILFPDLMRILTYQLRATKTAFSP
jgi:hypothetical protein